MHAHEATPLIEGSTNQPSAFGGKGCDRRVALQMVFRPRRGGRDDVDIYTCTSLSLQIREINRLSHKMSGIEVAGLILGAFPLLLSGIEGYRKGYSKIGDWWTFQKKYKKFGNLVEVQHSVFRLNLRALLREVTYDDAELDRLMNDPRAAEWSSNDLARRLRDRLPSTHGVYVTTMRDMGLTLENLGEEMGFKNAGLQKWIAAEEVGSTSDTVLTYTVYNSWAL